MNPEELPENGAVPEIDRKRVPAHVAIIMDGNGRWAERNGLPRIEGHRRGAEVTREIIEAADDIGIKVLTLYAFSTENWKRPRKEVFALMRLLKNYLSRETGRMHGKNVKVRAIGDIDALPAYARRELAASMKKTGGNTGLILNLAVNYGARSEIIRGIKSMLRDAANGTITAENITPEEFGGYLYTAGLPDPDLLIRTGNEFRVSNFLLWQVAYAELFVSPLLWPEFNRKAFYSAIADFQKRKRRFGGLQG